MTADVVVRTREAVKSVMAQEEWPTSEMRERLTAEVLAIVDSVPYRGSDHDYIVEAWEAASTLLSPLVNKLREDARLRRMKTSRTIH